MFGVIFFAGLLDEVFQLCQRRHTGLLIFHVAFVFKRERGGRGTRDFDSQVDTVSLPTNLESTEPNIADASVPLTAKLKWHKQAFQGGDWGSMTGHATSRTLRNAPNVWLDKNKHIHKHRYHKERKNQANKGTNAIHVRLIT